MPEHIHPEVLRVASRQRLVILVILANFFLLALVFTIGSAFPEASDLVFGVIGVLYIAVAVTGLIAIFMLASSVYNVAVGVLRALLMFVPLLSLLTLLVVNAKANATLKRNDIPVGLMGAKLPSD